MEVKEMLFMNKGDGENSYAKSAGLTEKVAAETQAIVYKVVESLLKENNSSSSSQLQVLNVADLGCAAGPNTFTVMSTVIESITKTYRENNRKIPEIQFYLNDLVGNDFNTLFKGLSVIQEKYKNNVSCFMVSAPGSFYGRLFPQNSMHLLHSSYGIHWLSKAPKITDEKGFPLNKGRIYISENSSLEVTTAYLSQFKEDFFLFLKCRSPEMVADGRMIFIVNGRKADDPIGVESIYYWELLSKAISFLVSKGLIDEEKLDSYSAPIHTPSVEEIEDLVEKEGSFTTEFIEAMEIDLEGVWASPELRSKNVRAFSEPLISYQFGNDKQMLDMLYDKVTEIIVEDYKLDKASAKKNVSIVAVLKKKHILA